MFFAPSSALFSRYFFLKSKEVINQTHIRSPTHAHHLCSKVFFSVLFVENDIIFVPTFLYLLPNISMSVSVVLRPIQSVKIRKNGIKYSNEISQIETHIYYDFPNCSYTIDFNDSKGWEFVLD